MSVYNPKMLAQRWGVSRTQIYNLMRQYEKWLLDGKPGPQRGIAYFKLGGAYRIRGDEVERIEKCGLQNIEASGTPTLEETSESLYVPTSAM